MGITFTPLCREQAEEIAAWRYAPPYDVYDYRNQHPDEAVSYLLDPANTVFAVLDDGTLIGFRSFGPDGRVPGGRYDVSCLDTGGGLRPDMTGQGLGEAILRQAVAFGSEQFETDRFRVTIAAFNERALKVCRRVGFREGHRFDRTSDGRPFVVLTLDATPMLSPSCLIDSVKPSDLEPLQQLYTDPACRQFLGGPVTAEQAVARTQQLLDPDALVKAWAIRTDLSSHAVGLISLGKHHDGQDIEISYMLLPEHQGAGLATRAVGLALRYAFDELGLLRVIAETQSVTVASIRLLNRLEMTLERCVTRFGEEQSIYVLDA